MSRQKSTIFRRKSVRFIVVVVLAVVGFSLIKLSGASGFASQAEAESGAIAGAAMSLGQQTGSSGSSTVKFGSSSQAISCDQAGIQKMVDSVSSTTIEANIRKLAQDDTKPTPNESVTRYVGTVGNTAKVQWARQQYVSYGLQDVSQNFTSSGRQLTNVVARLSGTTTPNTVYGTGGHIDSTSNQKATLAPGADDNATGTIAAMEAGRVLKQFQACLKSSVEFVGFNDEEEGMMGSETYANSVKSRSPKGFFNMDMLGTLDGSKECSHTYYNSTSRDMPFFDMAQTVSTKYKINLTMDKILNNEDNHDTANLWAANQPALFFSQCGDYQDEHYHSTTDLVQYVNMQQTTKVTKVVVALLAELAMK